MGAKHTPGPWVAEPQVGKGAWVKGSDGQWAALSCGTDDANGAANARLIASAPDLLEVARLELIRAESDLENEVQWCVQWDEDPEEDAAVTVLRSRRDFIAAAIARATGEAA
jgi:hypothetical protein